MAGEGDAPWWWAGVSIFLSAVGFLIQQFMKGRKEEQKPQHMILEGAEIADVEVIRRLATQFGPALEKLNHIDTLSAQAAERQARFEVQVKELLEKLERMERAALVAKEVREEMARRLDEQERQNRYRRRSEDRDE
jgi:hypothetical protein